MESEVTKMTDDLFLFSGTLGRKKYGIYLIVFLVGYIILNFIITYLMNISSLNHKDIHAILLLAGRFTLFVLLNILVLIITFKRIKDINGLGIFSLVSIVPYIQVVALIALLLIKGRASENKVEELTFVNEMIKNN